MPLLPSKAWQRQLPFRKDDGIFEVEFIEDRRKGLEEFINKYACDSNCLTILTGLTLNGKNVLASH